MTARRLYRWALRIAGLGERRCAWCGRLLGWRRGTRGQTSHGICRPCQRRWLADANHPQPGDPV